MRVRESRKTPDDVFLRGLVVLGWLLAVAAVVGGLVWAAGTRRSPPPSLPPLLVVGQTYVVLWSCLAPPMGCYGEVVRVEAVRPDGWVEVAVCQVSPSPLRCEERWVINPVQALAVQPYTAPGLVSLRASTGM